MNRTKSQVPLQLIHTHDATTGDVPKTVRSATPALREVTPYGYGELSLSQRRRLHRRLHRSEDLQEIIGLLYRAVVRYCGASGLRLRTEERLVELGHRHATTTDLHLQGAISGQLRVYATAEHDPTLPAIMHLAEVPLQKALAKLARHDRLNAAERAQLRSQEPTAYARDALLLVGLDQYQELASDTGEAWAHSIMCTLHEQLRLALPEADGVFHVGDDELAVLLGNVAPSTVNAIAERARILVSSLHLCNDNGDAQLTACIGASVAGQGGTPQGVLAQARKALQRARDQGLNQISLSLND